MLAIFSVVGFELMYVGLLVNELLCGGRVVASKSGLVCSNVAIVMPACVVSFVFAVVVVMGVFPVDKCDEDLEDHMFVGIAVDFVTGVKHGFVVTLCVVGLLVNIAVELVRDGVDDLVCVVIPPVVFELFRLFQLLCISIDFSLGM